MQKIPSVALLAALGLSLTYQAAPGAENQLIDDYWHNQGDTRPTGHGDLRPATPARTPAATRPQQRPGAPVAAGTDALIPAIRGLPPPPGDEGTYRLAAGDLLKIKVFQVDELSSEERVSESGQIVMPLIGEVKVAGLTPREAEARIAATLGRTYLQDPQVDINVKDAASRRITVLGSVKKPGVFPITGRTTLLQVIALAEGTGPLAKEGEVILFRADAAGQMLAYVVDLKAIQKGTLPDPIVIGDDRVMVPESGTAAFFAGLRDTLRGFVSLPIR